MTRTILFVGFLHLLVDLLLDSLGSLSLLGVEEGAQDSQGLSREDESGGDSGLALANDALLLVLLGLRRVDLENVVAALDALVVGEEEDVLGVVVEVRGGLLDNGETLVEGVERLVAKRVGTLDVRRDVLVRLGEVRDDGKSEGLVGRVTERDGALSDAVGLDGGDAIGDQRVVEEVL